MFIVLTNEKEKEKKIKNKKCKKLCYFSFHILPLHSVLREKYSFTIMF